jgi:hypothetical protein
MRGNVGGGAREDDLCALEPLCHQTVVVDEDFGGIELEFADDCINNAGVLGGGGDGGEREKAWFGRESGYELFSAFGECPVVGVFGDAFCIEREYLDGC